jgi:hypothetical protein
MRSIPVDQAGSTLAPASISVGNTHILRFRLETPYVDSPIVFHAPKYCAYFVPADGFSRRQPRDILEAVYALAAWMFVVFSDEQGARVERNILRARRSGRRRP